MKTVYLLIVVQTILSTTIYAQRSAAFSVAKVKANEKTHFTENNDRSQKDTLWWKYHEWPGAHCYKATDGNFLTGNNKYGDK